VVAALLGAGRRASYLAACYASPGEFCSVTEGLLFQGPGLKLEVCIKPAPLPNQGGEPFRQAEEEGLPRYCGEGDILPAGKGGRILFSPLEPVTAFFVPRPWGLGFAFVFYPLPDMEEHLAQFLMNSFHREAGVLWQEADCAAQRTAGVISRALDTLGGADTGNSSNNSAPGRVNTKRKPSCG
jgi:hypothetical protein